MFLTMKRSIYKLTPGCLLLQLIVSKGARLLEHLCVMNQLLLLLLLLLLARLLLLLPQFSVFLAAWFRGARRFLKDQEGGAARIPAGPHSQRTGRGFCVRRIGPDQRAQLGRGFVGTAG